jgi:signal transduction histidine kinase
MKLLLVVAAISPSLLLTPRHEIGGKQPPFRAVWFDRTRYCTRLRAWVYWREPISATGRIRSVAHVETTKVIRAKAHIDPITAMHHHRATEALAGLRTAVHDIHPPILDELGLEGALSALSGRSAIPCLLTLENLERVPAALESASYFIVAEALSSANKYSDASQILVVVGRDAGQPGSADKLLISVEDNGSGGALERPDGGLAGIRRRTEAFESSARFESPAGGPTTVKVELPCEW